VLDDIHRVLSRDGKLFMLGVTTEDLTDHPLNEFFPMKLAFDSERYPSAAELEDLFSQCWIHIRAALPAGQAL